MTLYDTKIPFRMILALEIELSHNIHSKGASMINPFLYILLKSLSMKYNFSMHLIINFELMT